MFLFQATNLGAHRGAVWRIDSWVRSQKMTSTVAPFSIDGEISRSDYSWNTQWDKKHLVFSPGPRAPARTQWDKKHMDIGAMLPEIQGGCYAPAGLAGIGLLCGGE